VNRVPALGDAAGGIRTCPGCRRSLEVREFNFEQRPNGRHQAYCRECTRLYVRAHYERNKPYGIDNARARNGPAKADTRRRLFEYLSAHPCVDCGETDARVLQFDHEEPARESTCAAELFACRTAWSTISAEIANCAVRCAKCHQRRTAEQFGWYRLRAASASAPVAQLDRAPVFGTGGFAGSSPAGRARSFRFSALTRELRPLPVIALVLALWPTLASASPVCASGVPPIPVPLPRMVLLIAALGETVGEPLECVHANLDNGDLLQQTSTGLLIYRATTGAAIFTNGYAHWSLGDDGLLGWLGSGLDPPWLAISSASGGPPGAPATVLVRTAPGATCGITYLTPSGSSSHADGLEQHQADEAGEVAWSWRIGPSTRRGTGQVTVNCDGAVATEALPID